MIKKHCEVRDPCHYTRTYRSAAHNVCNLNYKKPREIHNFIMVLNMTIIL